MSHDQFKFIQRVLESAAPISDRLAAAKMVKEMHKEWHANQLAASQQPARKALTEQMVMDLTRDLCREFRWPSTALDISRAIEAAHGITGSEDMSKLAEKIDISAERVDSVNIGAPALEVVAWQWNEATWREGDIRGRGWKGLRYSNQKPGLTWMCKDIAPLVALAAAQAAVAAEQAKMSKERNIWYAATRSLCDRIAELEAALRQARESLVALSTLPGCDCFAWDASYGSDAISTIDGVLK